jgi:hypothetical protein
MSITDQRHPGPHPDPELLNAFIEGVLPEHERKECVSHFAECARCREIVFLAQPPKPSLAIVPMKRRWYLQVRVLSGAIAAGVLVVALSLYRHQPVESKLPTTTVESEAPTTKQAPPAPEPAPVRDAARKPAVGSARAKAKLLKLPPQQPVELESAKVEPPASIAPATPSGGVVAALPSSTAPAPPAPPKTQMDAARQSQPAFSRQNMFAKSASSSEIKGSVTEPSGAAISGATVTIRALSGTAHDTTKTDASGEFLITGLPAGRYEVQIESSGFSRSASEVELKPNDLAMVASTLSAGSTAETVEVTAAAPVIQSETLSGKRPFATTVASGTRMLAVDAAGALYFSHNQGKQWRAIKPNWYGKVAQIVVLSADTKPIFQLTTDSGARWFSPDGTHWHPQEN